MMFCSSYVQKQSFFNIIFVSSHMYPENPKGTQVILGSVNMGYDIYPTLPGIKLTTCSVPTFIGVISVYLRFTE